MLNKAFAKLGVLDRLILHSDQGCPIANSVYGRRLGQHHIGQSQSRKGNCLDNATIEGLFGTLKSEFFYLKQFLTFNDLQARLKSYIH